MGLWTEMLAATGQTVSISGGAAVPCRAERAEGVGGGGFYYQDWVVYCESRVAYGASATVAGDVARTCYSCREVRSFSGAVVGYKAVLGHVS